MSNPPYIPTENITGLQAEVGKHEPRLALDGGADGLNDLLHLCNGAASILRPGGFFIFEVTILILQESKSMKCSEKFVCFSAYGLLFEKHLYWLTLLLQTNGERQSMFLLDYMETRLKGYFRSVKITSDFAGIKRFVGGYRTWLFPIVFAPRIAYLWQ